MSSKGPKVYEIMGKRPKIHPEAAFISENAVLIGDVEIGRGCTIFDGVVIEGFPLGVKIGDYTNIQSGTVIHGLEDSPTVIGDYVTVGHQCLLHGCRLEDYVTIGLGATVMGYSVLKKGCFVGARALVTERKVFEEDSLILGVPGKAVKKLPPEKRKEAELIAMEYYKYGRLLDKERKRIAFEDCIDDTLR